MKKLSRRLMALLLAVFMVCPLTGCMVSSVEELYSLPEMSEEYVQLRELISQSVEAGASYAAPIGGSNRQSVQLRDLDGDGTAEALAFLADQSGAPMVHVYRQDEQGDYYLFVIIAGDGSAVASVDYGDLDGDAAAELIIAWQISGDIRLLSVYSMGGGADPVQLLNVDCTSFLVSDLDQDGTGELFDLRMSSGSSTLVMYSFGEDGTAKNATAVLSDGISTVLRAVDGTLSDGTAALFVESELETGGIVTDVLTAAEGRIRNITLSAGRSHTVRDRELYAADVDGDRVTELPRGDGSSWTWYSLDADGRETKAIPARYDWDDGWSLLLSAPLLADAVAERTASGDRTETVFTVAGDGTVPRQIVLAISTFTGEDRLERAASDGRFLLAQDEERAYAAQIMTDELSREDVTGSFNLIYTQWQTGDL